MDAVTIVLKSKDSRYVQKFPITSLDLITLSHDDKTLQRLVQEAQENCKEEQEEIEIKISFIW